MLVDATKLHDWPISVFRAAGAKSELEWELTSKFDADSWIAAGPLDKTFVEALGLPVKERVGDRQIHDFVLFDVWGRGEHAIVELLQTCPIPTDVLISLPMGKLVALAEVEVATLASVLAREGAP